MASTPSQASRVAFLTSGMERTGECPWQQGCYPSEVDLDLLNPAGGHKVGDSWRSGWCAALMMMVAVMMAMMMVEVGLGTRLSTDRGIDQNIDDPDAWSVVVSFDEDDLAERDRELAAWGARV